MDFDIRYLKIFKSPEVFQVLSGDFYSCLNLLYRESNDSMDILMN
ncbi:hypothetical protein LEP1GSC034_1582 [Leptospira interrogans str. 2003000735]|uniref:Uncharacterized protein n=13 Tax=Leptospira interrogans TaxID=173 RepID=A0A0E2DHB5_LEPIR|nr:hypothetical protein LEP1GSC045_3182 [Leptospira interrogans serovar Pomona str. Kennewicki LC82-25]EJP02404.1 hypothetical protein LEP1GSC007_0599 [Leptospira interrogans serovar Bulgarica str. Mallika]EJP13475.1 hypothetical protein LEP1GSC080_0237 [Leptospira interrogans str. FPW2026]EKN90683.1 hypothetical protein LEP1GSC027_2167 [Leptospira interrogans str. 2002000624]EKN98801.1 hypothetical protein LEP1GSC014_2667 [Leptospira interrogans serovar Pomona str. Pomona]EKO04751.1 hypotheti